MVASLWRRHISTHLAHGGPQRLNVGPCRNKSRTLSETADIATWGVSFWFFFHFQQSSPKMFAPRYDDWVMLFQKLTPEIDKSQLDTSHGIAKNKNKKIIKGQPKWCHPFCCCCCVAVYKVLLWCNDDALPPSDVHPMHFLNRPLVLALAMTSSPAQLLHMNSGVQQRHAQSRRCESAGAPISRFGVNILWNLQAAAWPAYGGRVVRAPCSKICSNYSQIGAGPLNELFNGGTHEGHSAAAALLNHTKVSFQRLMWNHITSRTTGGSFNKRLWERRTSFLIRLVQIHPRLWQNGPFTRSDAGRPVLREEGLWYLSVL